MHTPYISNKCPLPIENRIGPFLSVTGIIGWELHVCSYPLHRQPGRLHQDRAEAGHTEKKMATHWPTAGRRERSFRNETQAKLCGISGKNVLKSILINVHPTLLQKSYPNQCPLHPALLQVTGYLPYAVDMVLESGPFSAAFSISGQKFTDKLKERRQNFDDQFEQTFGLEAKVCVTPSSFLDKDKVCIMKVFFPFRVSVKGRYRLLRQLSAIWLVGYLTSMAAQSMSCFYAFSMQYVCTYLINIRFHRV